MRRILGNTANRGSAPASSPWRGGGSAPGTTPPRPPAEATLLLLRPLLSQGHLLPNCMWLPSQAPRSAPVAPDPGPPAPPKAPKARRADSLRCPLKPPLRFRQPRGRCRFSGSTPSHFLLSSGTRVPGHRAPPPPAETGRSGRRINSLVHSLCGLGKTPGRVELSAA